MSVSLIGPDGVTVNLDEAEREFAASMAKPSADEPLAAAPPKRDPEPEIKPPKFGYKADGEARKRKPGPGRPPNKPTPSKQAETPEQATERRRDGIAGVFQISGATCLMLHTRSGDQAFLADAITLDKYAEPMTDAVIQTCAVNPAFAAAIDRVTKAGPYAALCSVGLSMTAQLAMNHGVTAAKALGASDPSDLIKSFEGATDAGPTSSA